jgi:hypothetical protein
MQRRVVVWLTTRRSYQNLKLDKRLKTLTQSLATFSLRRSRFERLFAAPKVNCSTLTALGTALAIVDATFG